MSSSISSIDLGTFQSDFSTTANDDFTFFDGNYQSKLVHGQNYKPSDIYLGNEEVDYTQTSIASEKYRGMATVDKEHNRQVREKNSNSHITLGYESFGYETSSLVSKNHAPDPVLKSKSRRHLVGVVYDEKLAKSQEVNLDKTALYKDDVTFGSEPQTWITESESKFKEFPVSQHVASAEHSKTQWTLGAEKPDYTSIAKSSYLLIDPSQRIPNDLKPGKKGNESSVFMGTDKICYKTSSLMSKQYTSLEY